MVVLLHVISCCHFNLKLTNLLIVHKILQIVNKIFCLNKKKKLKKKSEFSKAQPAYVIGFFFILKININTNRECFLHCLFKNLTFKIF